MTETIISSKNKTMIIGPDQPFAIIGERINPTGRKLLAQEMAALSGSEYLYFYDAMAPIVTSDSVDLSIAFRASRYDKGEGEGDYLNCPMTRQEYERFVHELVNAETSPLRDFEREDPRFFEACLPVEVLAGRGEKALSFGPLKPVGLNIHLIPGVPHDLNQEDL